VSAEERATLEIGRIIKAHGLKGQVLVDLWTDRVERLDPGSELYSDRGPLIVKAAAEHQPNRYIVTFDRITNRNESETWRGVVLSAEKLEDDSVIWIDDLFDAEVFENGVLRGKVVDVEANPASDILILDTGFLVPLTFVTEVAPNERIEVEAPEGLFDNDEN